MGGVCSIIGSLAPSSSSLPFVSVAVVVVVIVVVVVVEGSLACAYERRFRACR